VVVELVLVDRTYEELPVLLTQAAVEVAGASLQAVVEPVGQV